MKSVMVFLVLLAVSWNLAAFSQSNLYVFQVKGDVRNEQNIKLKKGDQIKAGSTIKIQTSSSLTCVDKDGNTYINQKRGAYPFSQILKHKTKAQNSVTTNYFKYVWNELTNQSSNKTTIGGVFRGKIRMTYPLDSAKVLVSDLVLEWDKDEGVEQYFVFAKKSTDEDYWVLPVLRDTSVAVSDHIPLQPGEDWIWSVSENEFANPDNLPFYRFRTISKKEYKSIRKANKNLIKTLSKSGVDRKEIDRILLNKPADQ